MVPTLHHMPGRTFGQIIAILAGHDQTKDLTGVIIDDGLIDVLCERLASLPVAAPDEVRRAWDRSRDHRRSPTASRSAAAGPASKHSTPRLQALS